MQWYEQTIFKKRLKVEILLMERNGVNFKLYQDDLGRLLWRGQLCVLGYYHGDVRLVYPESFPYKPIKVYIFDPKLPKISHHIHEDGSICYIKPDEWSPEWTAYAVYLTTIRFLHDFYSGKI